MSAAFSPIITDAGGVLPDTSVGMIEHSTTRSPVKPSTFRRASTTAIASPPILQVPHRVEEGRAVLAAESHQVVVSGRLRTGSAARVGFAERLESSGKLPKVVIAAGMRKLLTSMNTIVKTNAAWHHSPAPKSA